MLGITNVVGEVTQVLSACSRAMTSKYIEIGRSQIKEGPWKLRIHEEDDDETAFDPWLFWCPNINLIRLLIQRAIQRHI